MTAVVVQHVDVLTMDPAITTRSCRPCASGLRTVFGHGNSTGRVLSGGDGLTGGH